MIIRIVEASSRHKFGHYDTHYRNFVPRIGETVVVDDVRRTVSNIVFDFNKGTTTVELNDPED